MANINVRKQLERISNELSAVGRHIHQYSGIDEKDMFFVDNTATEIAELAAGIASLAREKRGDRSAGKLKAKVRKALGFTYP